MSAGRWAAVEALLDVMSAGRWAAVKALLDVE